MRKESPGAVHQDAVGGEVEISDVIADGGTDMEGDSDSLEECYNLLEKKRQNIGPAGVPQVRPMRDVEVRIHQEFSLNHPGVLYFASFSLMDC